MSAPRPTRPARREDGFVTIQFVLVAALSLVLLTSFANLVLVQYGRAAVQHVASEAARAGSFAATDAEARDACQLRLAQGMRDLLGGAMFRQFPNAQCLLTPTGITAELTVDLRAFAPLVPDVRTVARGRAVREVVT